MPYKQARIHVLSLIDDIKNVLQEWSLGLSFGQLSTEKQVCVEGFHHLQEIFNSIGVTVFSLDQEVSDVREEMSLYSQSSKLYSPSYSMGEG